MSVAALHPLPPRAAPLTDPSGHITMPWYLYFKSLQTAVQALQGGLGATIVTAKLTTANGSMTFTNGVLTSETPAT